MKQKDCIQLVALHFLLLVIKIPAIAVSLEDCIDKIEEKKGFIIQFSLSHLVSDQFYAVWETWLSPIVIHTPNNSYEDNVYESFEESTNIPISFGIKHRDSSYVNILKVRFGDQVYCKDYVLSSEFYLDICCYYTSKNSETGGHKLNLMQDINCRSW